MKVHTIDLRFQGRARAIASFLIEGETGKILVETGPEACRQTLLEELASRGICHRDIDAVFVTHIHLDHAGGAGWWAREGIPVYVHPRGAKHLIDPTRLEESARQIYADRFDELWGALVSAPEEFIRPMEDEERVRVGDLEILAVESPGHCFHHHAYAIGDVVFCGDAAGARISRNEFTSVTSAPPQFHLEHTLASLDRLKNLEPRVLFLTHFGEVTDPGNHIDSYREAVELNALFVRQRLEESMDAESLQVAYEAFQMEQAFRLQVDSESWATLQEINGTAMCADGIRLYWEKQSKEEA